MYCVYLLLKSVYIAIKNQARGYINSLKVIDMLIMPNQAGDAHERAPEKIIFLVNNTFLRKVFVFN